MPLPAVALIPTVHATVIIFDWLTSVLATNPLCAWWFGAKFCAAVACGPSGLFRSATLVNMLLNEPPTYAHVFSASVFFFF